VITDSDFTRWEAWLNSSGIVKGDLTPSKYYTNDYNGLAGGSADTATSSTAKKG
jgi:hypothetical protein